MKLDSTTPTGLVGTKRLLFAVLVALAMGAVPLRAQSITALEVAKLEASDAAADDVLGFSASLSGERALVGAYHDGTLAGIDAGSACVFERQGNGTWAQVATLVASDGAAGDIFGSAVSMTGARALVGAPGDDTLSGTNAGSAYVFERQGDGSWLQMAKLLASDGADGDGLGNSVSLTGERALVGAYGDDMSTGLNFGSAYLFERQTDGGWVQVAKLVASAGTTADEFGTSVSLSGDRALVGALFANAPASLGAGAAFIFERQGNGSWIETAKLGASDGADGDYFGAAVSLDGQRALVGAYGSDSNLSLNVGAAYVFERHGGGNWREMAKLEAFDGSYGESFGFSVSLAGEGALVGSLSDDAPSGDTGSAFLFNRNVDGSWIEVAKLVASDGDSFDFFGRSVALSAERALVGAVGDNTPAGANAGSAYVFRHCDGCLVSLGPITSGCANIHELDASLPPETGMAAFALIGLGAPPTSVGFLGLADVADVAGSDPVGLGVLLHIDILASSFLQILAMPSDAAGTAKKSIAIPSDPALVGFTFVAQALWSWTSCSLPPLGLSSSPGLLITILAP